MPDWGVAMSPHPGERQSGDAYLVRESGDAVVLGVVDALGHGDEAAEVAHAAVAALAERVDRPLVELVGRCHDALGGSRGAALTVASVAAGAVTWLAVGNVEGVLARRDGRRGYVVQRGGVVGSRLPALRVGTEQAADGDVLLLATDGVAPRFADAVDATALPESAQAVASEVHREFATGDDDALVLAARFAAASAHAPPRMTPRANLAGQNLTGTIKRVRPVGPCPRPAT